MNGRDNYLSLLLMYGVLLALSSVNFGLTVFFLFSSPLHIINKHEKDFNENKMISVCISNSQNE